MDVINQIIRQSPLGPMNMWIRNLVISLFLAIIGTLLTMLVVLLTQGHSMTIQFGY